MSKRRHALVTGTTGFVGSHLTYRLLQDGYHVTAVSRESKGTSARERVLEVISRISSPADGMTGQFERLSVLEADISKPNLGVSDDILRSLASQTDETWHCAASLLFAEDERDEIFQMNVAGTEHLLDLVERTPTRRLHHVSTAYVAGDRELALESEIDVGQTFRNPYEESKCQAELLIARKHAEGAIAPTVYRPTIVIGDSHTGRATHFHGVYAFIRGLSSVLARLRRRLPTTETVHLPLRVLGNETTTLNFVPIDYVVNAMVAIGSQASVGGTYHLANPHPTENGMWLPHICRLLHVEGIQLVGRESFLKQPMTKLEMLFQKQMAFYYMYLQGEPRFDCSRTLEALHNTGIECPRVTIDFIEKMAGWYVGYLGKGGQD